MPTSVHSSNKIKKLTKFLPHTANKNPSDNTQPNARDDLAKGMRAGQWQAKLGLKVANRKAGARLVSCRRLGPLHIQKAFYPEGTDLAHLYILHPPGGLVSGDTLTINAEVQEDSHALITTPGAGRLYGARDGAVTQTQLNQLHVAKDASLEWFPMETLMYSRSYGVSKTRVDIEKGGKFMGWDISSLGLPASGQPFVEGELRQCFDIHYDGKIDWLERWRFNADDKAFLSSQAGLQNQSCNGVFIVGPFINNNEQPDNHTTKELVKQIHALCETTREQEKGLAGVSQVSHWIVVRYLGHSTTHARDLFTQAWHLLRPQLLKRPACAPRIWTC